MDAISEKRPSVAEPDNERVNMTGMISVGICIFEKSSLWYFSDSFFVDIEPGKRTPISASFKSHWLDFGDSTKKKKALTVYPTFLMQGEGHFELGIECDSNFTEEIPVQQKNVDVPFTERVRISKTRFNYARFTISSDLENRPKIFSIVLTAQS